MADIENVIKGLESLYKSMHENQCYACSHEFIETANEFGTEIIADALELLEKQVPITPYTDGSTEDWSGHIFCKNCCKMIEREYKCCPNCGQAIKWEAEESKIGMFPYDKLKNK